MFHQIHIETKGNNIFRPFLKGLDPLSVSTVIYFLQENQQYKFVHLPNFNKFIYNLPNLKIYRTVHF